MPFDAFIIYRYSCRILSNESLMIYYVKDITDNSYRYYIFNEGNNDNKFEVMFDETDLPDVFHKILVRCHQVGNAYLPDDNDMLKNWTNYGPYLMRGNEFSATFHDNKPRFSIKYTCKNKLGEEEDTYMKWLDDILYITRM